VKDVSEEERIGKIVALEETPAFSEFRMLLEVGRDAYPGELVFSKMGNSYHIGRVFDAGWVDIYAEPAAVHLRSLLGIEEKLPQVPGAPGRFRIAKAEVLEEATIEDEELVLLPSIRTLATPEAPVYRATKKMVELMLGLPSAEERMSYFTIGTLAGGGEHIPIPLPVNDVLSRHVLIVGTTGSGKTWARGIMMEELQKLRLRQINFDVHGEYVNATEELVGINLKPGINATIRLSSLSEMEVTTLLPLVHALHIDIVQRAFANLKGSRRMFDAHDLLREIADVGREMGASAQTINMVSFRTQMLERARIVGEGADWQSILKNHMIINLDCRELTHTELHIVVGAMARELLALRQRKPPEIPPIILGVDEAHMFLPYGGDVPSSPILREVIRFGRHYGIGLILVTPSPLDIDRRIVRTTNTRLIFAIEPDQLEALRGVFADAPEDLIRRLPKFEVGTCLLTGSRETIRHAISIHVRSERKTTHGGETPDLVNETLRFEKGVGSG